MNYPAGSDQKLKRIIKTTAIESGTPFYLYDSSVLLRNLNDVMRCFSWQEDYLNYFPVRENPNPVLLTALWDAGCGMLACGKAELQLCGSLGFSGSRVMYQPIFQDAECTALASHMDTSWLVTSPALIPNIPCAAVMLRYCPQAVTHHSSSYRMKTGFTSPELVKALQLFHARNVPRIGLEIQLKPFDFQKDGYFNKAKLLFAALDELCLSTDAKISVCNLGDTARHIDRTNASASLLEQEALQIKALWERIPAERRPIIHTGLSRYVMESAGILVSKVLETRCIHQNYLVLDASVAQFLRAALFHAQKDMSMIHLRRSSSEPMLYNIAGPLPDEFDRLSPAKVLLSAAPGDLCVIHDVGCGARAMPMLYNFQPLCPEYIIEAGGTVRRIAAGKSQEEVMEFMIGPRPE